MVFCARPTRSPTCTHYTQVDSTILPAIPGMCGFCSSNINRWKNYSEKKLRVKQALEQRFSLVFNANFTTKQFVHELISRRN